MRVNGNKTSGAYTYENNCEYTCKVQKVVGTGKEQLQTQLIS